MRISQKKRMKALTIREANQKLIETLLDKGFNEASSDVALLMEYIADIKRNDLFINGDKELSKENWEKLDDALKKRMTGMPVQYITGYQNFMGLEFMVNENVLIPRQDTEILVEEILKLGYSGIDILDMCTGSGCILLSLLKYIYGSKGLGVDISKDALEIAKKNSESLSIPADFICSDLFNELSLDNKFDLIVSNPPYIKSHVINELMREVKDYEPHLALDGDEDGLKFYRIIVDKAKDYLRKDGMLYFEIGYDQGEAVRALMTNAGFKDVCVVKDLAALDRVVFGRK